jgi:hypothetical protein
LVLASAFGVTEMLELEPAGPDVLMLLETYGVVVSIWANSSMA